MTTPRIEEMVEEFENTFGNDGLLHDVNGPIEIQKVSDWLRQALTQAHHAGKKEGVDEAVEILERFIEEIPEAYGWGEEDKEADRGYQVCSKNVKAMGRKALKALQDNK